MGRGRVRATPTTGVVSRGERGSWRGGARRILVSDARRPADLDFFGSLGACVHVRVQCADAERVRRGWVWEAVVDEGASECGLDGSPADVFVDGGSAYDAESVWAEVAACVCAHLPNVPNSTESKK